MNSIDGQLTNIILCKFCDCIKEHISIRVERELKEYFTSENFLKDLSTLNVPYKKVLSAFKCATECLTLGERYNPTNKNHIFRQEYERRNLISENGTRVDFYQDNYYWRISIEVFTRKTVFYFELEYAPLGVIMK